MKSFGLLNSWTKSNWGITNHFLQFYNFHHLLLQLQPHLVSLGHSEVESSVFFKASGIITVIERQYIFILLILLPRPFSRCRWYSDLQDMESWSLHTPSPLLSLSHPSTSVFSINPKCQTSKSQTQKCPLEARPPYIICLSFGSTWLMYQIGN